MNQIVIVRKGADGPVMETKKMERLTLENMQGIVCGHIEIVHPDELPPWACVVCDDEGKLKGRPGLWDCHIRGWDDTICGTFFVCAEGIVDGEPDLVPMTKEQVLDVKHVLAPSVACVDSVSAAASVGASQSATARSPQETRTHRGGAKTEAPTVPKLLEEIVAAVCDGICKWCVTAEDIEDLQRHCEKCPVGRLVE